MSLQGFETSLKNVRVIESDLANRLSQKRGLPTPRFRQGELEVGTRKLHGNGWRAATRPEVNPRTPSGLGKSPGRQERFNEKPIQRCRGIVLKGQRREVDALVPVVEEVVVESEISD